MNNQNTRITIEHISIGFKNVVLNKNFADCHQGLKPYGLKWVTKEFGEEIASMLPAPCAGDKNKALTMTRFRNVKNPATTIRQSLLHDLTVDCTSGKQNREVVSPLSIVSAVTTICCSKKITCATNQ